MKEIVFESEFFNARDTLECGQVFRFYPRADGYALISVDKACFLKTDGNFTVLSCNEADEEYFLKYFDLQTDYRAVNDRAKKSGYAFLSAAAEAAKGIRILRQDPAETMFSFLISQNNNIPRIKSIIEKLCDALGEEREFCGTRYKAFPDLNTLKSASVDFYKSIGTGYRAEYFYELAQVIGDDCLSNLSLLGGKELKKRLLGFRGIGDKVADCIRLFGFHKTDSFPVDVWMEKIYKNDFGGILNDRNEISEFFVNEFGDDAGYFQQYLFHYKRNLQRNS